MKRKKRWPYWCDACVSSLVSDYGYGVPPGEPITLNEFQIRCWRQREAVEKKCRKSSS